MDAGTYPQPTARNVTLKDTQLHELLYQALETEIGGQDVYRAAIDCAQTADLKDEWKKYLEETENHERVLKTVFERVGLDPGKETPGRKVIRHKGQSLVKAMQMARKEGPPEAAELVAAECIVEAETKDHQNWQLIGAAAKHVRGDIADALREAHEKVEDEEDEHLYHTMGWARELWIKSLGLPAVIPPPEEEKDVKTAIGRARAEQSREDMLQ